MIGYSVKARKRQVSVEMVNKFKSIPVANISDVMSRIVAGGPKLRPMHAKGGLAGPAVTVKTRPGDNLMVHHAFNTASPGDVIVVDAGGDLTNAIVGELMLSYAKIKGLAGVIIHGAVRDYNWINTNEFPVYAGGVTHRGPYKDGPGEINVPIAIDGMVIHPGDLMLGDADGVLCVPIDAAGDILKAAQGKLAAEKKTMEDIAAGKLDQSWIAANLARIGYKV